ncbi:MAG: TraB/GumN family protein [Nitrospirales bacterium]
MRVPQRSLLVINVFLSLLVLLFTPGTLQAGEKSCLWRVTSNYNTVYVLGSVHVLRKEHYPLNDNIYEAFDAVQHLVFEVNLDSMSSPENQIDSLRKGMLGDGQTLKDVLAPDSYGFTKTTLQKHGYNVGMFTLMKPWMLAMTLTILELQKLGFETDHGVDQHFFEKAKTEGKSVEGFETVEYQLSRFDSLPFGVQEQFLLQTLGEIGTLKQQTQNLVQSWTSGRVEGLEVMLEKMQEFPEVYEALISQRNNNWMPHIETYLQENEPYMIVVGTLHLVGEEGLLAMLKKKGYMIQQL